MPKDNETIQFPLDGPVLPNEPLGFTADQMIRCEGCLRANPPTKVTCIYCGATLPLTEASTKLRKPTLRQPEKHETGFNCISLPAQSHTVSEVSEAASLLKLSKEDLQKLLAAVLPLPLARTASKDEAELVSSRLRDMGLPTIVLTDEELGLGDQNLRRLGSLSFSEDGLVVNSPASKSPTTLKLSELRLIVSGRLIRSKVEVTERLTRRAENEILETNQFFSDESVLDLHLSSRPETFRIAANSFDFSCLQAQKTFVAGENLKRLRELLIAKSDLLSVDDSYHEVRNLLEAVWPVDQETQSRGWRRQRPGKISVVASTLNTNQTQFMLHSRLRRYFLLTLSS